MKCFWFENPSESRALYDVSQTAFPVNFTFALDVAKPLEHTYLPRRVTLEFTTGLQLIVSERHFII